MENSEETKAERLDRELNELVQELRVLLPGVQVLFAFLLTIPFSAGFEALTGAERALYMVAFCSTTASAVLLIAPSARHRGRFRDHDKEQLVNTSNRLAMMGTVFLAVAIAAVVLLIGEYLYGWAQGAILAAAAALFMGWFWYGWSVMRRTTRSD